MIKTIMKTMASENFFGSGGTFHRALMFMLKLGWQSRFRLPILLVIVLVAMDYRLQLEIEFEVNPEQHNHL
ncbi:hypothetical protein APICC_07943 [Apis cerana cerana]|uniref:Uncharacterized protein n=1 Tax=Apis cerana cerana TaxID=94128 RepID=A0A2A3EG19_APICC|nr:hypothetical protein APICC_07943 [Apis cerana cerana]